MPRGRTVIRFTGTKQDAGSRHLQIGQLLEVRNCRQLKTGEYRKRPGFDRADPLETLVIDTSTYRRGSSILTQNQFSVATTTDSLIAATEVVLSGASTQANVSAVVNFPQIGVARARASLTALVSVTTNPVTLRIKAGATPSALGWQTPGGAIVGSLVLPVGASQVVDLLSGEFALPSQIAHIQATAESPSGSAGLTTASLVLGLAPVGGPQGVLLSTTKSVSFSGETLAGQWYVDFDQLDAAVTSVVVAPAWHCSGMQIGQLATMRVRIGGTANAFDGTIVATVTSGATGILGTSATIARPTGRQLVKFTCLMNGFVGVTELHSILIRAA